MTHGVTTSKGAGLCPHGFPNGACPLCSGMGGGGSSSTRNIRRNPGEMTYNECYAIWQRMKASKLQKDKLDMQQTTNMAAVNAQNQANFLNSGVVQKIAQTPIAQRTINVSKTVVKNISNIINKLTNFAVQTFNNVVSNIKNFIIDISDKIAAVFGEIKQAIIENTKKTLQSLKEKIVSFFGFLTKSQKEEETEEVVKKEAKKIFSLQELRRKLRLLKENKDDDNQSNNPR